MGLISGIGRAFGWAGQKIARRSQWLARRLWLIAVAEGALVARRHWKRLEPGERERLVKLARKSKGRPSKNLTAAERREAGELLDKMGHIEFAGRLAEIALPFKPLSRLATRILVGRQKEKEATRAEGPSAASPSERTARPPRSESKAGSRA